MAHDPVRTLVGLALEACRQGRQSDALSATREAQRLVAKPSLAYEALSAVLLADTLPSPPYDRLRSVQLHLFDALTFLPPAQE